MFVYFCIIGLIKNYYIIQSRLSRVVLFNLYLFIPFVIALNKNDIRYIMRVIKVFCIEHIFFTYFIIIFKGIYINYMLPIISNGDIIVQKSLIYWAKMGYNAGITSHYSTNGIYLSISSIFFLSIFLQNKRKSNLILFLLSFIGLILTAKRGLLVFSIMSFLILYLVISRRDEIKEKIRTFFSTLTLGLIALAICSIFIPSISNVFNRFYEGFTTGNLLSGRNEFYIAAITEWVKKPIFGHGWGYFSEYYQDKIFDLSDPAYNREYLDCHNVYIQLLCETGIVGFLIIIGLMIIILHKTYKLIDYHKKNKTMLPSLLFSLGYQIFFLLYCMSGNPLYDPQCYVLYFVVIGITICFEIMKNKIRGENINESKI